MKTFYTRLLLLLALLSTATTSWAVRINNIDYELTETEAYVTGWSWDTSVKSLDIPETIEYDGRTCTVTRIYMSQDVSSVETMSIPKTVSGIYYITHINQMRGNHIKDINVDSENKTYSSVDGILFDKNKTKLVLFPASKNVERYTIPNTVTNITGAFNSCQYLKYVSIPESIKVIGDNAFEYCPKLESLDIPKSVTSINYNFRECPSLNAINVDEGNTKYSSSNGVLYDKDKKELIYYPAAKKDKVLTIPNSVTSISSPLYECSSLEAINVESENQNYSSIDGVLYNKNATQLICCPPNKSGQIKISSDVTYVKSDAFKNCNKLTHVFQYAKLEQRYYSYLEFIPQKALVFAYRSEWDFMKKYHTYLMDIESPLYMTDVVEYIAGFSFKVSQNPMFDNVDMSKVTFYPVGYQNIVADTDGRYIVLNLSSETTYDVTYRLLDSDRDVYYLGQATTKKNTAYYEPVKLGSTFVVLKICDGDISVRHAGPLYWYGKIGNDKYNEYHSLDLHRTYDEETQTVTFYDFEPTEGLKYYKLPDGTYESITTPMPIEIVDEKIGCFSYSNTIKKDIVDYRGYENVCSYKILRYGLPGYPYYEEIGSGNSWENMSLNDLAPGTKYTINYSMEYDVNRWWYSYDDFTFTTKALTWENGEAKATSTTSARLSVKTSCDAESGTGIEWRRIDAPDLVPSTKVACPVVDGYLVGSLRNLNPDVYYKFRPFYTSASGNTYYGEWVGLFTGDASMYFEPEVRTFDDYSVKQNSAQITGYALAGSDDIDEQGFEYWKSDSQPSAAKGYAASADGHKRVTASGIKMTATIGDLDYGTTYRYRAYVTTAKGSFYGQEYEFTTEKQSGISDAVAGSEVDGLTVALRENPATGTAWVKVAGAETATVKCDIHSLNGSRMMSTIVNADGSWQPVELHIPGGVYLLTVSDGRDQKAVRLIVR